MRQSAGCGRALGHFHDPLSPGPDDVDDGLVIVDILQDGSHCAQLAEVSGAGLVLHALQLVAEGQFLVAVVVREASAVLERSSDVLKQGS